MGRFQVPSVSVCGSLSGVGDFCKDSLDGESAFLDNSEDGYGRGNDLVLAAMQTV